jgi:hypothetical protein
MSLCEALVMGKDGALENVNTLNLMGNNISMESEASLVHAVEECPNLQTILLTGNSVDESEAIQSHPRGVFK